MKSGPVALIALVLVAVGIGAGSTLVGGRRAAQPSSPTVTPSANRALLARAKSEFLALQRGRIDRSHYVAKMNAFFTSAKLAELAAQLQGLGDPRTITRTRSFTPPENPRDTISEFRFTFAPGTQSQSVTMSIDPHARIDGIYIKPA